MTTYDTPGAYIERADRAQGGITRLRTDIAAFVGIAEKGPARRAVAVDSWKQFTALFGDVFANGYLAYVVKAFFENGGRRCWIVRVEGEAAAIARRVLAAADAAASPVWALEANSSGAWGNALTGRLVEVRRSVRRAARATRDWAEVDSIAGFERATTVELIQDTGAGIVRELKILSAVDALRGRLIWNAPGAAPLSSDAPLAAVDPVLPFRIETIACQLQVASAGRPLRVYDNLAPAPDHPRYGPKIANGVAGLFAPTASNPRLREAGLGTTAELVAFGKRSRTGALAEPVRLIELRAAPRAVPVRLAEIAAGSALTGGVDGLSSLTADDFIGADMTLDDSDAMLLASRRGLAALSEIDEVSVVAVPDIHIQPRIVDVVPPPRCEPDPCLPVATPIAAVPPPVVHDDLPPRFSGAAVARVMGALVQHCETRGDRLALIDPPFEASTRDRLGVAAVRDFRRLFDSTYAALYFPWIEMTEQLPQARSPVIAVPPSGHVAGQMAATDLRIGVHKAPANVPLLAAERATFVVDEATHGLLNSDGVNVIRALPGRGLRVCGARLVSSDLDFRFVNVRRLLLMIERSLESAIQWAVFEGNDWLTRAKLALTVDSFLRELWSRGALMGASPQEAFFVRCDDTNNPSDARARGELLLEIGVAASVPFEFVVLRLGRSANGLEITEADAEAA